MRSRKQTVLQLMLDGLLGECCRQMGFKVEPEHVSEPRWPSAPPPQPKVVLPMIELFVEGALANIAQGRGALDGHFR